MTRRFLLPLTVLLLTGICFAQTGAAGPHSKPADAPARPRAPIPVIFDTDIGYDIDDTWALAFLLASPELDLKLVVTDAQDTIGKAKIVAKFLEAAGRTEVPVGIGLKRSDTIGPQRKWITDYELSQYPGKVHEDGVQAMIDVIMTSPEPVTLLATGPVPNLPEALKREPRIAERARLIGMAGSVAKPHPEWNIRASPTSARLAYMAAWDVTLAPLDTAGGVQLTGDDYARVRDADNPMARALIENFSLWRSSTGKGDPRSHSSTLYDTVAVYLAFDRSLCRMEDLKLRITPGSLVERHEDGKLMHVAMEWNDLAAFERMVAERIAGYRPPPKQATASTRPSASLRGSRPNMLIIVSDDHGILDAGCYGSTVCRTPNLDRLAAGGLRFTDAFVATAMCTPSRSTLYTGLYPHRHGAHANHSTSRKDVQSLPHYLRPLGYRVGLAGKRHIQPAAAYPFEYMDVAAVERFISRDREEPFCLVLASNDPHTPYKVPSPGKGHDRGRIQVPPFLVDTPKTRELLDHYYTSVEALDSQVGEVLAMLERLGLTESTLVWYVSDHGAGVPFSKWTLYDAGLRVPCIVRWPGRVPVGGTDAMISLADILPTCIDLAGGTPQDTLDGRSLIDVLAGTRKSRREVIFATHTNEGIINGSRYPIRAVRTRTHKYIRNFNPDGSFENLITRGPRERHGRPADAEPKTPEAGPATEPSVIWPEWLAAARTDPAAARRVHLYQHRPAEELYDLRSDPYELKNLAADPAMQDILTNLRARLANWMREQDDPLAK